MATPSSNHPSYFDPRNLALKLTEMLHTVNQNFSKKEGRIYLVLKDHELSTTADPGQSSSIAELSSKIFDKILSRLPAESTISSNLYNEIMKYTENLIEIELETPKMSSITKTMEISKGIKVPVTKDPMIEPFEAPSPPPEKIKIKFFSPTKRVEFNESVSYGPTSRVTVSTFSQLIRNPNISINDLTNTFNKEICKGLRDTYYQEAVQELIDNNDMTSKKEIDEITEREKKNISQQAKLNAERISYYLSGAFHQILSNVTDLIEQDEIETSREALDQLHKDFEKIAASYQENDSEEIETGSMLPPTPLGPLSMQFLQSLILQPVTTQAFMNYFQQIIREKEESDR